MRLRSMIIWDIRCQARHGLYLLYAFLTALYAIVILLVPEDWKDKTAALLIFSDPASMSLFFMGAIVLLEKSQRTPSAMAISPCRSVEYVVSKVVSLSVISLVVAVALAVLAGASDLCMVALGTGTAFLIFTLLSIVIAARIRTLNQFILWAALAEALFFVPAFLHLYGIGPSWLKDHPTSACLDLISGVPPSATGLVLSLLLIGTLATLANRDAESMLLRAGGGTI